jgi:hypothetical protein
LKKRRESNVGNGKTGRDRFGGSRLAFKQAQQQIAEDVD